MERNRPQPEHEQPDRPASILKDILGNRDKLDTLVHTRNSAVRAQTRRAIQDLDLQESASLTKKLIMGLSEDMDKTRRRGAETLIKLIKFDDLDPQFLKDVYINAIETQDPTPNTGIDYALRRVGKVLAPYLPEGRDTQKEIDYAWEQAKPNKDNEIRELHNAGFLSFEIATQSDLAESYLDVRAAKERIKRRREFLIPLTRGGLASKVEERRKLAGELDTLGFTPKEIAEKLEEKRDVIRRDLYIKRKKTNPPK